MSIPDTSYLNTYLADTMTNGKAAADLVTGAMNPSSYTDPLLSSLGIDQLPNLDPTQVAANLVGGLIPPDIIPFPIPDFGDIAGSIGDIVKLVDPTEAINKIMSIVMSMSTVASYVDNGIRVITDGNLPDDIKNKIVALTATSIAANGGTAAASLYSEVAAILEPFTSGHSKSALSLAIEANQLFSLATKLPSASDALLSITESNPSGLPTLDSLGAEYDEKAGELTALFNGIIDADGIAAITENSGVSPTTGATLAASGGGGGAGGTSGGGGSGAGGNGLISFAEMSSGGETNNPPTLSLPPPSPEFQFKDVDGNWDFNFESGDTNQFVSAGGSFVSSVEELECEMSAITRDVSEVIVHWSETFTNANLTASQVQSLTGEAYHYIIKRDGSMERQVSVNSTATASPKHNSYSIQVCLVGGVNVASGDEDINGNLDAGSITRTQYNTLHELFRVFFVQFPGGQALGHGEFAIDQLDPGFEVRDYVYNSFNKTSLYADPLSEAEKSPDEIISSIDDPELLFGQKDTDKMLDNF
jgi:hypothetical protein